MLAFTSIPSHLVYVGLRHQRISIMKTIVMIVGFDCGYKMLEYRGILDCRHDGCSREAMARGVTARLQFSVIRFWALEPRSETSLSGSPPKVPWQFPAR